MTGKKGCLMKYGSRSESRQAEPDLVGLLATALVAAARLPELLDRLEAAMARFEGEGRKAPRDADIAGDVMVLSVKEMCVRSGLSASFVRKAISTGTLPSIKVGSRRLIPLDAARNFMKEGT